MKKIFAILAVCIAAAACQPRLVIIHTNDTHSHFDPVRGGASDGLGGIIERAAFIDSIRAKYPAEKVLMLHAGDFNQGT
jgi:5'-nucleotidase